MTHDMNEYSVEIDKMTKESWHNLLDMFDDSSLYQSWSFDSIRFGEKRMSHIVIKRENVIVAAAQVLLFMVHIVNKGIAYIRWGPMWRRKGEGSNCEHLRIVLRAAYEEYSVKRGLILKIYPLIFNDEESTFRSILKEEKFRYNNDKKNHRTLLVDMSCSLEDLRKGLNQKWRNHLNKAEKNEMALEEGVDEKYFAIFERIYNDMHARKKFENPTDITMYKLIQRDLPSRHKMRIIVCKHNNNYCSGVVCSAIGNTGIYLLGATSEYGMKMQGAYLIQWSLVTWLKNNHYRWYNLHSINPVKNPGNYTYKSGLAGRNGKDLHFIGNYDAYNNGFFYAVYLIFEQLLFWYRYIKRFFRSC